MYFIVFFTFYRDDGTTTITIRRHHEIKVNKNVDFNYILAINILSREIIIDYIKRLKIK